MVASSDEHFREMVRDSLANIPTAKIVAEYQEVAQNLYIRVLQDLERHAGASLVIDLSGDPEAAVKALERVKQAAPNLYVIASNFQADGETVIACMRAGANEFLIQPLKRTEFRDAMGRLERAPKSAGGGESKLGKVYTFIGTKGGVGVTTLAVNFASVLAQRKRSTVLIDLDWIGNDVAMQLGAQPQYTLMEVADNLSRMDQALFEGFVTRDPLGFYLVGPPDALEQHGHFSEQMFREFATFLVEKYDHIVVDGGRAVSNEVVMAAAQVSAAVFLVVDQPRSDPADAEPTRVLRHPGLAGGDRRHQPRAALRDPARAGARPGSDLPRLRRQSHRRQGQGRTQTGPDGVIE